MLSRNNGITEKKKKKETRECFQNDEKYFKELREQVSQTKFSIVKHRSIKTNKNVIEK